MLPTRCCSKRCIHGDGGLKKIDVGTASRGQNNESLACKLQEQRVALEGVLWLYHQLLAQKGLEGKQRCAESSWGRKTGVAAMALIQAGTGALAVRQGMGMSPKNHEGGETYRPVSCSAMGQSSQRQRRADAGSEAGGGRCWREISFRERKKTTSNHKWSFPLLTSLGQNMNETEFLELAEEFLETGMITDQGKMLVTSYG